MIEAALDRRRYAPPMTAQAIPQILAAGLSSAALEELRVALRPWGPVEPLADVVGLLARVREGGADLVVLPADQAEGVGAAERLRRAGSRPVVCLVGEGGLGQRLVRHLLSEHRAQVCLDRPIPTDFLHRTLEPLLPRPAPAEESARVEPSAHQALRSELAEAKAALDRARSEADQADAARLSELALQVSHRVAVESRVRALEAAAVEQAERLSRREAELRRAAETREADRLALQAARDREAALSRSVTALEARLDNLLGEQAARLAEHRALVDAHEIRGLEVARLHRLAEAERATVRATVEAAETELAGLRAELDAAREDAVLARDEAIADLRWFMGELGRLRGEEP